MRGAFARLSKSKFGMSTTMTYGNWCELGTDSEARDDIPACPDALSKTVLFNGQVFTTCKDCGQDLACATSHSSSVQQKVNGKVVGKGPSMCATAFLHREIVKDR